MKYYRLKQDTFMWDKGAIIQSNGDGYRTADDIWNRVKLGNEYISEHIIEDDGNADFFERVYPVNLLSKTVYKIKAEAKEMMSKEYDGQ